MGKNIIPMNDIRAFTFILQLYSKIFGEKAIHGRDANFYRRFSGALRWIYTQDRHTTFHIIL